MQHVCLHAALYIAYVDRGVSCEGFRSIKLLERRPRLQRISKCYTIPCSVGLKGILLLSHRQEIQEYLWDLGALLLAQAMDLELLCQFTVV